jgi:hypothetical protein
MAVTFDPMAIAADLSDCICAALKDEARGTDVWAGTCCVRPGSSVPWDSCCDDGGQAWVVMTTGYPTTAFPTQNPTTPETSCSGLVSLAVNFEIGVLRCVPMDMGDCDTSEESAAKLFGDLQALLLGVNCCFSAAEDEDEGLGWRLNGFEMLGPLGGCGGAKINIVVHTEYPCCPITP